MDSGSDYDEESEIAEVRKLMTALEEKPSTNAAGLQPSSDCLGSSALSNARERLSKIETALSLNKETDEKLRELEGMLNAKLQECRQRLRDAEAAPGTSAGGKSDKAFKYINCGKPYFKGPDNVPAPDNEDTIQMAKCRMYDCSSITPVSSWTVKDKSEFIAIVHSMSVDIKTKELNSKIAQLQRQSKGKESMGRVSKRKTTKSDYSTENKISAIRKELCNLNKKSLSELALPIDEEYDWDMVAIKTNHKHSAQEYRSLWKLYLHPSINKSTWTQVEHIELQKVAHANDLQDWDKIAAELGTGRTAYQCFVYYRTNMSNTFTGLKWSKEEEEYLKRLIEYSREGEYIPWGKVASYMEKRTKIQIYNKYLRLVEQRKGRFLPEEDAVILTCVQKFGPIFRKVMKYLPGRSMSQLRARYNVLCTGRGTKTSIIWSADEDKKLIQLMANQDAIVNYSSLTQHFPGKDRAHIRGRYTTLLKWMKQHPNRDISKAPRRGARRLGHGEVSQDLNRAVENLKKKMQSKVENKKSTKINKDSLEADIDNAIVAALINEMNKEELEQKSKMCDSEQSVLDEHWEVPLTPTNTTNLRKTLILLKAKLDKTKFQNSYAAKQYPELLQDIQEQCQPVKSYSRSSKVVDVNVKNPDIWSKTLATSEYVLPPNYSTITACRKLMAYASTNTQPQEECPAQTSIQSKRNMVLKDQMDILLERCNNLFVWPMLLSTESPNETTVCRVPKAKPPKTSVLAGDPGVAIPIECTHIVNENINLVESANEDDITVKDIYVGNDDYLFLK